MVWTKVLTIMLVTLIQLYVAEANDGPSSYIQEAQQQQIQLLQQQVVMQQQQVVVLQTQINQIDQKMLEDSIQQRINNNLRSDSTERRINDIELKNYKLERSVKHLNNRLNLNDNKNSTKVDMMLSDDNIANNPIGDHVEERLDNLEEENIKLKQEIQHLKHVYRKNSNAGQHLPVVKDVASANTDYNFRLQNINITLSKVLVDNKNLELNINTTLSEVLLDNKNIKLMLNKVKDQVILNTSDLTLGQVAMNHSLSKCLSEHDAMHTLINTKEDIKSSNSVITFSAFSTRSVSYSVGQTIIFDKVIINEGSQYYPQTSIFRCEHPGYYSFSLIISGSSLRTELVVGGKSVTNVFAYDHQSASATVVFPCERGDQVFVRCTDSGTMYGDPKNIRSSFTGTLLFPLL